MERVPLEMRLPFTEFIAAPNSMSVRGTVRPLERTQRIDDVAGH